MSVDEKAAKYAKEVTKDGGDIIQVYETYKYACTEVNGGNLVPKGILLMMFFMGIVFTLMAIVIINDFFVKILVD